MSRVRNPKMVNLHCYTAHWIAHIPLSKNLKTDEEKQSGGDNYVQRVPSEGQFDSEEKVQFIVGGQTRESGLV